MRNLWRDSMKNWHSKQNFTLLEMMVVVAIIIILVLIFMPAINSVKEHAKRTECLNRLKEGTAFSLYAAQKNQNRLAFSGANIDPLTGLNGNLNFQYKVMATVEPQLAHRADEKWRMFICSNVLPCWNTGSSANAGGNYGPTANQGYVLKGWRSVDPKGAVGSPWYCGYKGPNGNTEDQGPVYALGNFGVNHNGFRTDVPSANWTSLGEETTVQLSRVPSPSKRVYLAEVSDTSSMIYNSIPFPKYNDALCRGTGIDNSGVHYIPGLGGGGIGKEKYEKIGYASSFDDLDPALMEMVDKDVREGRHSGYTLHGFFDGHVESFSAERVGSLQLGPGDSAAEDLTGPYGYFTRPADDDEK